MSSETHIGPKTASHVDTAPIRSWTAGRIAALVAGSIVVLLSLALLATGGTALWADTTQRDHGYATTGTHSFSTAGSALVTENTQLGAAGFGWLYSPGLLGKVRIRITPMQSGRRLFVGIGRSSDVDRYLTGVHHTLISDYFANKVETIGGGALRSTPTRQHFWVASATGRGRQSLTWRPTNGTWTVVVMNADGRPGIDVKADLGARFSALRWIAVGVLAAGLILLVGGVFVIFSVVRGRAGRTTPAT